ncbi:M20 family metallopeptidase [Virgibacillus salexigens]|uniref:Peptidase M20 domain-containing protein 2 n=2 Tax=Virgibacillus TaxID=84406 RepID=A0A024Q5S1_9BACI|nr:MULTISPECIES: M20 family metallopeptidase [Virgibacillus]MYL41375.1 amidohydrolase [Virgibacillus massiliensis]GGJ56647.1 amidohydrolase [Virgibacillus kapii]CDQ37829.1 p-aminobenzoyl-glutamate hydrolase subunit B [Virgibacillus massiliensis]
MTVAIDRTTKLKKQIAAYIDANSERYIGISHAIHENPEIGNQEVYAAKTLTDILVEEGFEVEKDIAGHPTAFIARKTGKNKGRTIGFLAEYDALPGIGHACGHNMIGSLSIAAAIGLSKVIDEIGGELVVLGTPAEEGGPNGSAKGSFVKTGRIDDIDAAIIVHPGAETNTTRPTLAVDPLDFEFFGKPAHASAYPEQGINALDGVIQLFNGINALRQHLPSDVRIHGIITDGGDAPNIVPEYAKARFFIRAASRTVLDDVTARIKSIAEGAALATGSKVNVSAFQNQVDNFIINRCFDDVFTQVVEELGETVHTTDHTALGSTDAGNISQVIPTIHPHIKIGPSDLIGHTEAFRDAAKSEKADQALIIGAKAAAYTAFQLITDKTVYKRIQREFQERIKER